MEGIFDYRLPSIALREYVRLFQIVGCEFPADMVNLPVKVYWPRAENCLSFWPREPITIANGFDGIPVKTKQSALIGQHSIVTNRHVGRNFMVFQVVFQPGALFRLTGVPSHELANKFVDAEDVFSTEIKMVNERLQNIADYIDMIPVVELFLQDMIARSKKQILPIDRVGRYLLNNPGIKSLDWLADQACLSQRQFYRQFMEREGVGPKLYARIARFENAMKIKNANPTKNWFAVAIDLGYSDYQHLVKDFKQFTNHTPNAFYNATINAPESAFGVIET